MLFAFVHLWRMHITLNVNRVMDGLLRMADTAIRVSGLVTSEFTPRLENMCYFSIQGADTVIGSQEANATNFSKGE